MSDNSKDHYNAEEERAAVLNRLRSTASVTIDPELFEKLYLSPPNKVRGDLRKTFGNPTPMSDPMLQLSTKPKANISFQWCWGFLARCNTFGV
jgi:hypothetical protein